MPEFDRQGFNSSVDKAPDGGYKTVKPEVSLKQRNEISQKPRPSNYTPPHFKTAQKVMIECFNHPHEYYNSTDTKLALSNDHRAERIMALTPNEDWERAVWKRTSNDPVDGACSRFELMCNRLHLEFEAWRRSSNRAGRNARLGVPWVPYDWRVNGKPTLQNLADTDIGVKGWEEMFRMA